MLFRSILWGRLHEPFDIPRNCRIFLKTNPFLFTLLIIRQIGNWDGHFSDQDSILAAILMSLVAIPFIYRRTGRRDKIKRKKSRKLLWKLRMALLRHYFKREKSGIGSVLILLLGTAAIVGLILLLGWIPGLAVILGLFVLIVFVIHPPD